MNFYDKVTNLEKTIFYGRTYFPPSYPVRYVAYNANETQEGVLKMQLNGESGILTKIMKGVDPTVSFLGVKALRHMFNERKGLILYKFGIPLFKQAGILEPINQLKEILYHKTPQNRPLDNPPGLLGLTEYNNPEGEGINSASVFYVIKNTLKETLNVIRPKIGQEIKINRFQKHFKKIDPNLTNYPFLLLDLQKMIIDRHYEQIKYAKGYSCRCTLLAFKILESLCEGDDSKYNKEMKEYNLASEVKTKIQKIREIILESVEKQGTYGENPQIAALKECVQEECKRLEKQLEAIEYHSLILDSFYYKSFKSKESYMMY